ncbi:MAG: twin-arginine translocation signal domain-containing protein, partial [Sulfuricella sp.]
MDTTIDLGRRDFLKAGAALGAGLTIAFYLPSGLAAKQPAATTFKPNA